MMKPPQHIFPELLTKQQQEILVKVAKGKSNRQIANELYLSPNTVKNHKANIIKKLGLTNANELLLHAAQWLKDHEQHLNGDTDTTSDDKHTDDQASDRSVAGG
ncbi:MAG: response regulator transcription factor [Runella sp.]